jgi:hypothetical protein
MCLVRVVAAEVVRLRLITLCLLLLLMVCCDSSSTVAFVNVCSRHSTVHSSRCSPAICMTAPYKSAASAMARKIGLQVVPNVSSASNRTKTDSRNNNETTKKRKGRRGKVGTVKDMDTTSTDDAVVPVISWESGMERFFWGPRHNNNSREAINVNTNMTMHQMQMIGNQESFPLVILRGAVPAESLAWALELTDGVVSQEIEQHERLHGRVRALRRSLVSQLDPQGELLQGILSQLPVALVGNHGSMYKHSSPDTQNSMDSHRYHAYEDGSVVYYRRGDFYDEHHDSYALGEPPRDRQRAYTILLYLRTPPGPPSVGGTEFTRLTPLGNNHDNDDETLNKCVEGRKDGTRGLIVKPRAGDALVWPNFDRDGNPYQDSAHRALPVAATAAAAARRKESSTAAAVAAQVAGKVVVNLWFEGSTKKTNE